MHLPCPCFTHFQKGKRAAKRLELMDLQKKHAGVRSNPCDDCFETESDDIQCFNRFATCHKYALIRSSLHRSPIFVMSPLKGTPYTPCWINMDKCWSKILLQIVWVRWGHRNSSRHHQEFDQEVSPKGHKTSMVTPKHALT